MCNYFPPPSWGTRKRICFFIGYRYGNAASLRSVSETHNASLQRLKKSIADATKAYPHDKTMKLKNKIENNIKLVHIPIFNYEILPNAGKNERCGREIGGRASLVCFQLFLG